MQKISANLWFENQAKEAAELYTSIFDNAAINTIEWYGEAGKEIHGREPGSVMTVDFELDGASFTALNGGPYFTFNPSVSFFVNCRSAGEADELWNRLSEGGKPLMPYGDYPFSRKYGWTEDRYGLSWQIILPEQEPRQRFVPCLLFAGEKYGRAEEAIGFYTSLFREARQESLVRYGPGKEPDKAEALMYADFELEGQIFAAMESAQDHAFDFNEAVSFIINCSDQAEVDHYWDKLSAVPESEQCGWVKDRFGVSWQVVPTALYELMKGDDRERADRVMSAMLQMKKLDIEGLKRAAEGR